MASNLAVLTKSHNIVASKRRLKKEQIKEIAFDEDARRDFLSGFHKRKVQQKEESRRKARERERQERLEARREKRRLLAEKAAQNASEVERAYGAEIEDDENPVTVFSTADKGKQKAAELEDEYEDEEQLATVTIVEDFDPHELIHGPARNHTCNQMVVDEDASSPHPSTPGSFSNAKTTIKAAPQSRSLQTKVVKRAKDIKYQTQAARKDERAKQRRRSTEKAERAGGKAARRKISRGGRR